MNSEVGDDIESSWADGHAHPANGAFSNGNDASNFISNNANNGFTPNSQTTSSSTPNGTASSKKSGTKGGKHLRWVRIQKEVEIRDLNTGLMRGSIAGPTPKKADAPVESGATDAGTDVENATGATGGAATGGTAAASKNKDGKDVATKTILHGVSGSASPGQILALMGPSGSGKTSMLDILAGRSSYSSGSIHLQDDNDGGGGDGNNNIGETGSTVLVTDRIMKKLKKQIAYVKQSDLFFGHLTVRDQLTYTAMLRLPSTWPKSRKVAEVDKIIDQLHLGKCAETPIFMISGGEKKRVNIGTELLTDPSIILLDEPTSGLDSTSAVALMRILHWLAREGGKTIITSIHQPSSMVFFSFDKLMLLADGNVVYYGTPHDSLDYVRGLGLECPSGYNAADHWMDLLVVDSANNEVAERQQIIQAGQLLSSDSKDSLSIQMAHANTSSSTKQKLIKAWDADGFAKRMEAEIAQRMHQHAMDGSNRRSSASQSMRYLTRKLSSRLMGEDPSISTAEDHSKQQQQQQQSVMNEKSFNSTWTTQYTVLVHRSLKNSRSAIFTPLNLTKAGAIGLMCGLLWFQMPYTESTVYDRSAYVFFTMTFWVFDAMFQSYMAFPLERSIIFKERASGSYHLSAYFLAKTTSEAPARLALPSIYMVISYWLSGVNNNFGIFVGSTVCSLLSVLAGESIGLFMGAAIMDMEKGMVIMTVTSLGLMVIGGFFVRNIPHWLTWLGYLSPFKYSYNSSVNLIMNKPVPCDGSGNLPTCLGRSEGYASVEEVKDFLGVDGSAGFNVGMLFILFAVIRVLAFYALKSKKAEERMA